MMRNSAELTAHVLALGVAFQVQVVIDPDLAPHDAAAGYLSEDADLPGPQRRKSIRVAPITDETTYAVALHELGHCLSPTGMITMSEGSTMMRRANVFSTLRDVRLKLLEEESAWQWARHYALEWTDVMTHIETMTLGSYIAHARRFGVKG